SASPLFDVLTPTAPLKFCCAIGACGPFEDPQAASANRAQATNEQTRSTNRIWRRVMAAPPSCYLATAARTPTVVTTFPRSRPHALRAWLGLRKTTITPEASE